MIQQCEVVAKGRGEILGCIHQNIQGGSTFLGLVRSYFESTLKDKGAKLEQIQNGGKRQMSHNQGDRITLCQHLREVRGVLLEEGNSSWKGGL